jgi:phosphoglycolate phosphatase
MSDLTVVFDLDGTLVDTAPDLVATLNVVLAHEGLPPVPYDEARNMVGAGARRMIELGLSRQGRTIAEIEVERMFHHFIAYYSDHIADHSKPFPGLADALDALEARHCRLAVCTNKLEGLSRQLLDALGLSRRFAAICGPDTFKIAKPNPEILQRTIKQAGGTLERAILVGDSATDINTARAAAVPVIAVDFGYTDIPVSQLGPDRVIGHFDELPAMVFELLPQGR